MPSPPFSPYRAAILMAMLAITPPIIAGERPPAVTVLQPGGYNSADLDVATLPSRGWLALVEHAGHWALVPAKVTLEPDIHSPDQPKALVFLHARRLSAGSVASLAMKLPDGVNTPKTAVDGKGTSRLELTFNAHRYRLRLSPQGPYTDPNLVLDDGCTSTLLDTHTDEATVMWAGDLDHDGRLDLIISTDHEDGQSVDTCLYLSSAAGKNQLVKQVACQGFSG